MKAILSVFAVVLCAHASATAATVELVAGPDVVVNYDPVRWKPLALPAPPQAGVYQSVTWELQQPDAPQITVTSHPERKDEAQFKKELLSAQLFRGDPAKLIEERRQSAAGHEFQVLEFRNENTRPTRREVHYFLPREKGYIALQIVGDEANLPAEQRAIDSFLQQIQVK